MIDWKLRSKFLSLFLIIFLLGLSCKGVRTTQDSHSIQASKPAKIHKRILVYPFQNQTAFGRGRLSGTIQEKIYDFLVDKKKILLLPYANVEQFLENKRLKGVPLVIDGSLNQPVSHKIWLEMGAHGIIYGEALKWQVKKIFDEELKKEHWVIRLKLLIRIDSAFNGKVFLNKIYWSQMPWNGAAVPGDHVSPSMISSAQMNEMVKTAISQESVDILQALGRIPWSGRILRISSQGEIIVNGGVQSGFKPRNLLKVIDEKQSKIANSSPKGFIQILKFLGRDHAICRLEDGGPFQVGDIVLL